MAVAMSKELAPELVVVGGDAAVDREDVDQRNGFLDSFRRRFGRLPWEEEPAVDGDVGGLDVGAASDCCIGLNGVVDDYKISIRNNNHLESSPGYHKADATAVADPGSGRSMAPGWRSGASGGGVGSLKRRSGRLASPTGLRRQILTILTKSVVVRATERPSKKARRPRGPCRGKIVPVFQNEVGAGTRWRLCWCRGWTWTGWCRWTAWPVAATVFTRIGDRCGVRVAGRSAWRRMFSGGSGTWMILFREGAGVLVPIASAGPEAAGAGAEDDDTGVA